MGLYGLVPPKYSMTLHGYQSNLLAMRKSYLVIFALATFSLQGTAGLQGLFTQSPELTLSTTLSSRREIPYLLGVAAKGGASGAGTIYRISTDGGDVEVLHNFDSLEGIHPNGSLLHATSGLLFGVTSQGGRADDDYGTLFKLNSDGTGFRVLIDFDGDKGQNPYGPLIEGSDGWLYGMAEGGGPLGFGTVFKIDPEGNQFTVLHNFGQGDGGWARSALMQASNGSLYGITLADGGTIFRINTDGSGYRRLRQGVGVSYGSLTEVADGSLVGMMQVGGGMDGTTGTAVMFKMKADGSDYSVIHTFHTPTLWFPLGSFLKTDGFLYGTTYYGGDQEYGTIFRVNEDGSEYTELYSFGGPDGALPTAGSLIRYKDRLYGTTTFGGLSDNGVIFNFDLRTSAYTKMADLNEDTGKYPMLGNFCLIVPDTSDENFSVIDTRSGEVLQNFGDSVSLDVSGADFRYLTIRANPAPDNAGSVLFRIDGQKKNIENKTPYLLQSRFIRSLSPGQHTMAAEIYSERLGKGVLLHSMQAVIELENRIAVERFDLVNEDGKRFGELVDGDTLTADDFRLKNLIIEAILTPDSFGGSVQFYLDEMPYRVENRAPYSVILKNRIRLDKPGTHTLSATPYGGKLGKGVPGKSLTVGFSIIAADNNNHVAVTSNTVQAANVSPVSIYPVPTQGTLHVQIGDHSGRRPTELIITNLYGEVLFKTLQAGSQDTITLDLDRLGLMRGMYYLQVQTGTTIRNIRFIKD